MRRPRPMRFVHAGALVAAAMFLALAMWGPERSQTRAAQADAPTAPGAAEETPASAAQRSARAATAPPPSSQRRPEELAAKSVELIASEIRGHIAQSPRYADLTHCDRRASQGCSALLTQAIFEAMDARVLTKTLHGGLGLRDLNADDDDALYAVAGRVLVDSSDSIERASALLLLRSLPNLPQRPLPEAAYGDLAQRSVAEAQLTLEHRVGGPIPYPEVARDLIQLFREDRDSRLQDSALTALAYPETETELLAAVSEAARKHGPDWPEWLQSVAPAVGTCGMACIRTIDEVLEASGDDARVAEELLRAFPEGDREQLALHMQDRFAPQALLALAASAGVTVPAH